MLVGMESVLDLKDAMQMMLSDKFFYEGYKKKSLKRALDFQVDKIVSNWKKRIDDSIC